MNSVKLPNTNLIFLRKSNFFLIIIIWSQILAAKSGQWTYGASLGLGGTGISTSAEVEGTSTKVERSESPGAFSLFADRTINDHWTTSFEHIRGFRFGPFSSGISFTGVGTKWYFWNPAPAFPETSDNQSTLFIQQLSPFVGVAAGLAEGTIKRGNDKVGSVSGSGIYFGGRAGFDYTMEPGFGVRSEGSLSFTFSYSEKPTTILAEFSLRIGIFYYY